MLAQLLWLAVAVIGAVLAAFGLMLIVAIWSSDTADGELLGTGVPLLVGGGAASGYALVALFRVRR